jgi:tetratricopeptide (TPR) repeat protein
MGIPLRLLFLAILAGIALALLHMAHAQAHVENPDPSKLVAVFGGLVIVGLISALILGSIIVPIIGERIGAFFFNPSTQVEHTRYSDALSKVAQGDPEGAIAIYEQIYRDDPTDTFALSEIARVACRDIHDTARGAAILEQALKKEWPQEKAAFLAHRLADIYLLQDDAPRARQMLMTVVENMPDTKFATQAIHRLRELEQTLPGSPLPRLKSS